jgi:hypothetical protein
LEREAACIKAAVATVLAEGARTADLAGKTGKAVSTTEMGQRVSQAVQVAAAVRVEQSA